MHCTTPPEPRGVQTLASACVLHLPHTLVQVFQVCSGDSKDSGSVGSGPGVGSKSGTGVSSREKGALRSSKKLDLWGDKGFLKSGTEGLQEVKMGSSSQ